MGKTEHAPASGPQAEATLDARTTRASTADADPVSTGQTGPTTESVSTLETSSAIRRLTRTRRLRVVAGSTLVMALGLSMWAFVVRSAGGHVGGDHQTPGSALPVAAASAPSVAAPATTPTAAATTERSATEPTVRPEVSPPTTAQAADGGAPPRPSAVTQKPPVKPASSARNMDKLLGDR